MGYDSVWCEVDGSKEGQVLLEGECRLCYWWMVGDGTDL